VAIELVLAFLALAGAAWSGFKVSAVVDVPPIMDGEPAMTSVEYHPPALALTLLLVTVSAVLVIVAVTRWRRRT
jgi:hypothetical protein